MVTIQEYAREVYKMRELQKLYFKTRNQETLRKSICQESRVDQLTQAIILPSLFE